MNKTFVLSDAHFGHKNIIDFCDRPFSSVDTMDQALISNWNEVVDNDDRVIFGGDFSWYKDASHIFNSLNGHKILIRGNHDQDALKLGWEEIHDRLEIKHNKKWIVIDHYPIENWNRKFHGSIHLFGHVHNTPTMTIQNRFCMCVEMPHINYRPVNLSFFTDLVEHNDYQEQFKIKSKEEIAWNVLNIKAENASS